MRTDNHTMSTSKLHLGLDVHKDSITLGNVPSTPPREVRLLRAGGLTPLYIPEPTDEAIRDLCRARTDAVDDQRPCANASRVASCATATATRARPTGPMPTCVTCVNRSCPIPP